MLGSRSLRLIAIPVRRESNFKPPISSLSHLTACKWIVVNSSGARISLGDCVGVGSRVGVGVVDGVAVGTEVGTDVSVAVGGGADEGVAVGTDVGTGEGVADGVGVDEGVAVGTDVGTGEGVADGVGVDEGAAEGTDVGTGEGVADGVGVDDAFGTTALLISDDGVFVVRVVEAMVVLSVEPGVGRPSDSDEDSVQPKTMMMLANKLNGRSFGMVNNGVLIVRTDDNLSQSIASVYR